MSAMAAPDISELGNPRGGSIRRRRRLAFGKGLLLAAVCIAGSILGAMPSVAKPSRIVSMNLCTDQITLALADRERIASLSYLVAKPDGSTAAEAARGILLNHGLSEEILPLEPDLVIAGRYTSRPTVFLFQRLGYNLIEMDISRSIPDIRARIRSLGTAVGEEQRAEALIEEFDERLASLTDGAGGRRPTAVYLQPNGYTAGRGSLVGDIIEHAGFENLGARFDISGHGKVPLETLLSAAPDVIITDEEKPRAPALAYEILKHPAFAALTAKAHRVTVPTRYWVCGMPETIRAVEILAEARRHIGKGGAP